MAKKGFNPEEYMHLVRYFTRKFVSKNPTFAHLEEDIKGQCFEEMVRASKRHDPEAGAVSTYCWNYFRSFQCYILENHTVNLRKYLLC